MGRLPELWRHSSPMWATKEALGQLLEDAQKSLSAPLLEHGHWKVTRLARGLVGQSQPTQWHYWRWLALLAAALEIEIEQAHALVRRRGQMKWV